MTGNTIAYIIIAVAVAAAVVMFVVKLCRLSGKCGCGGDRVDACECDTCDTGYSCDGCPLKEGCGKKP